MTREEEEGALLLRQGGTSSFEQEVLIFEESDVLDDAGRRAPLWAWPLLVAAVCAVSSAGVVFALMAEVPPITLAAWRLQLTGMLLGFGAAIQLRAMPPADRQRTLRSAPWLLASGVCLALHFGAWVYSTQATSLAHSLLFVSATPLLLAAGTWALRLPISRGELGGAGVGGVGAALLATAATRSDAQATLRGDMAALFASLCFIGYLLIGRRLRAWMPAFVYAWAVTGGAAALLTLGALAGEGARLGATGRRGALGWVADAHFLPFVLYLAVGPGIVGHTGFNTLLRHLSPLVISLACNMEPLLGSLIGWAGGVVPPPGPWTYGGGALIMGSTAVVSLASHRRELAASKEAASRAIQRILSGSSEASGEGLSSSGAAAEGGGPAGPAAALGLPVRRLAHEGGRPPGDSG